MITFGDPRDFAISIRPLQGAPPEPDRAAAATWVALEIHVSGKNLTAHTHEDSGTYHTGIHWPAVYLARWFVRSWPGLFESARWPIATHEANARDVAGELDRRCLDVNDDDPILDEHDRFVSRHALQTAAAGAIVPGIYLARDDMSMSVAWDSPQIGDTVFHHQQRGEAVIPVTSFLDVVRKFIDWITDQLQDIETNDRDELSAWLTRLDTREQARAVLLGYTGLSTEVWSALPRDETSPEAFFDLDASWAESGALADPTRSPIAVAFRCCSPQLTSDDLLAIRELVRNSPTEPQAMAQLERLNRQIPDVVGDMRDYEQGYELATQVRRVLSNEREHLDIEDILSTWGIPVRDVDLRDPGIDGGCICDPTHGPVVFVNQRSEKAATPWGRRMVLAHELCHLLFDRERALTLAILSNPWAPPRVERRANAFAAELLLPQAGITRLVGNRPTQVSDRHYEQLMRTYGIGVTTCTWHVRNRVIESR